MEANYFIRIILLSLVCFLKGCEGISFEGGATEVFLVSENGTVDELVLDCPYILDEGDASGLVVKWSYDDPLHWFYVWIPGGEIAIPQLTKLDELVDATYEHSTDPLHRYRALRLVTPTTAATGRYTCVVSSYLHEQSIDVHLTIYSLPSALSLSAEEVSPGNVTVQCSAEPAFPRPELAVSLVLDGERKLLEGTSETTWSVGLYNTSVYAVVDEEDLAGEGDVQFECELSLPPTNLSVTESLQFGTVTAVEDTEEYTDHEDENTVVVDATTHRSVTAVEETEEYTDHEDENTVVVDASTNRSVTAVEEAEEYTDHEDENTVVVDASTNRSVTAVEEAEEYTDHEDEKTVVVDASTHRSARKPSSAAPAPLAAPALQMVMLAAVALARWCISETPE